MGRAIFIGVLVAAVFGCVGDSPDTTAPNPSAADASTSGGPTGTNLAENGGFENGCDPFFSSGATLTSETITKRSGGKACKVCSTGADGNGYYAYTYIDVRPRAGEVYTVSAWMRKAPEVESGTDAQIAMIGVDAGGSALDGEGKSENGPIVTTDWKEATATWTVAKDGPQRVRVDIGLAAGAAGNCFIVDDVFFSKK